MSSGLRFYKRSRGPGLRGRSSPAGEPLSTEEWTGSRPSPWGLGHTHRSLSRNALITECVLSIWPHGTQQPRLPLGLSPEGDGQ